MAQPWLEPKKRAVKTQVAAPKGQKQAKQNAAFSVMATLGTYAGALARSRLWSGAMLIFLVGIIVYTFASERFFIRGVEVVGARHLDPQVISEAAGVVEQSVFWLDPRAVANKIIELPGVKAVRVQFSLPSEVTIEVQEREPVVLWRAESQGRDWWLDEDGVALAYHGDPESDSTIFVIDSSERDLQVGDRIQPNNLVQSVKRLAGALPGTKYFYYQQDRGLSFLYLSGDNRWPVFVGSSQDLARKIQTMNVLADYLSQNEIVPKYVDVRWADRPVYRVGKGSGGQ